MSKATPQTLNETSSGSKPELRDFLARLMKGENLSRAEATDLLEGLLNEKATDAQIAATLIALKQKGETIEELAGLAAGMRARSLRIKSRHQCFVDTAGTGSSRAKTFNVSTAAAFVIAGAGLPVAKHGNRAASSRCGSADVLIELGVNVSTPTHISETCLNEIGICFMFAPHYHGATARVAGIRRQLGVQTTFNLLGPLTNPAGAPRQLIGVWDPSLVKPLAQTLCLLSTEKSWVVHGEDGLDEVTITGKTRVAQAAGNDVKTFEISPADFGMEPRALDGVHCGDARSNASTIRDVLSGSRHDEARSLVIVNAAAALHVGGLAVDLQKGAQLAANAIDNGLAMAKLEELIKATN
jgi:anthranilate phosphoribosyltransferase